MSDRFVDDGKFSLTLRHPTRVISFREVSPVTARIVCRYLKCIQGGTQLRLDSSTFALELQRKPVTELLIEDLRDYPFGASFPSLVKKIHIKNVKLESFDTRLFHLVHLSVLTIENSKISVITEDIKNLRLVRLCLKSNMVNSWPNIIKECPLSASLTYLDLSGNRIVRLPENFWNLMNLETLNLDDNFLIGLPAVNLHRIRCLRNISLRNNRLQCLPFAFSCLQSPGILDLSSNPWMAPCRPSFTDFKPKSLFHYATVAFLGEHAKLFWSSAMMNIEKHLPRRIAVDALGVLRRCVVCLKMCGPESERELFQVPLASSSTAAPIVVQSGLTSALRRRAAEDIVPHPTTV
ncbi:hypothetical protein Aperf_G00000088885 [Anoplocephala perfoliata]